MVMKHTGDVKQAGKALMDELNTLHRMSQGQQGVAESYDLDAFSGIKFLNPKTGKMGTFYYWSSMEGKNEAYSMITNKKLVPAHDDGTPMTWDEYKQALDVGNQGVAEGSGQINEYRDRLFQYVKSLLPGWPDYVLKDWMVPNKGDFSNLPEDALKKGIMEKLKMEGLTPNTKWELIPNMKFSMDMWEPNTKRNLEARAGGKSTELIPSTVHPDTKDAERHATQAQLAKQQGGVRKEPVLIVKKSTGYELVEGWHRTIQHFHMYPDGYTGPAYVAVAQGQQGVAEDKESDPVTSAVLSFYKPVVNDIHKEKLPDYVDQARELLHKTDDPVVRKKLIDIFKEGQHNPYLQGGIITAIAALLGGGAINIASSIHLTPYQTNLMMQAILNSIVPAVGARMSGKNWKDTIKYTLASLGVGVGVAGSGLIEDELEEGFGIPMPGTYEQEHATDQRTRRHHTYDLTSESSLSKTQDYLDEK
jgi:hypothetical protein